MTSRSSAPAPAASASEAPVALADRRLVIVTGKGGVGKTTVCAAQAIAFAAKGKRVLVCMCNAKERLSTMLGSDVIGADVIPVGNNIWAVNMEPERAMEEYGLLTLKSKTLYKLLFDNKYVRTFFSAVPGLHEWAMLGKAWWHTTEKLPTGENKFDVVILDAPATGHGLDMLRVPKVIVELVPPGLLRRDAEIAWKMFQDPRQTGVILVTLPEEMPTTETIELAQALAGELGLPLAKVVVNAVLPPIFSKEERAALEGAKLDGQMSGVSADGDALLTTAQSRASRERVQAESMGRLSRDLPVNPDKTAMTPSFLPLLFTDAANPAAIHELAKRMG